MPYDYIKCVVIEVHDGDTVLMDIDQGLNNHRHEWLRLVDCYVPELDEPNGVAAQLFLEAFCANKVFRVKTFPAGKRQEEKRSFVRYIADVLFDPPATDGSSTLSELMVSLGWGTRRPT